MDKNWTLRLGYVVFIKYVDQEVLILGIKDWTEGVEVIQSAFSLYTQE